MSDTRFDIVGVGNAIVDVLAHAADRFLEVHHLEKGTMTLIDEARAERLYGQMGPAVECSGGSAANTIAGAASLGASCAFIGRVRDDQLGQVFGHDIRTLGVHFDTAPAADGPSTARCLIVVTPDAQRTMQTYLGASADFGPADMDLGVVRAAKVTYLEGYLWDKDPAKEAFRAAARAARESGRKVALSLSDPFCVERHREAFMDLIDHHIDILFANEEEIKHLYQVERFDDALQKVAWHCEIAALTRGAKGSVVVARDEVHVLDPEPVTKVVDTTGAGDAFAAGFLWGYTQGKGLALCGRAGGIAAAEVIGHMGARPDIPLKALVKHKMAHYGDVDG